jgi:transcriptional regulator with XRE-family HTH domain
VILIIRLAALAGSVISTVRTLTNSSQVAFADRSGVAASQISKYEMSLVVPSVEVLVRLLHAAGWHLVAMPALAAETAEQRDAVVEAARRYHASEDETSGLRELDAAIVALLDAEKHHAVPGAGPTLAEQFVRLRDRNEQLAADRARLRTAMGRAADLLNGARK